MTTSRALATWALCLIITQVGAETSIFLPRKLSSTHLHTRHVHHTLEDIALAFTNDDNGTFYNHINLLFRPSQTLNSRRWKQKTRKICLNVTSFVAAHELVTDRRAHTIGFEPPVHDCLVDTRVFNLTHVTSVPLLGKYDGTIAFAAFNNSGHKYVVSSLRNGAWSPALHETLALNDTLYCPSAIFLQDSNMTFANSNHYDPAMYQRNGDTWSRVPTDPFFRAGGENLGSLFALRGRTFASIRFNVPYNPASIGGHGYRSIGIYEVMYNGTATSSKVHSWLAPDGCLSKCFDDWRSKPCTNSKITLDGHKFKACFIPNESTAVDNGTCLLAAMSGAPGADSSCHAPFVSLVGCAHECRFKNQVYQPAVSVHGANMVGIFSRYNEYGNCTDPVCANKYYVCNLMDDFEWSDNCFHDESIFLTEYGGIIGHPVSSELVLHNGTYYVATASRPYSNCSAHVYHWPKHMFSFLTTRNTSVSGSFTVRIHVPTANTIALLCRSMDPATSCRDGLKVQLYDGSTQCKVSLADGATNVAALEKVHYRFDCKPTISTATMHVSFTARHKIYGVSSL